MDGCIIIAGKCIDFLVVMIVKGEPEYGSAMKDSNVPFLQRHCLNVLHDISISAVSLIVEFFQPHKKFESAQHCQRLHFAAAFCKMFSKEEKKQLLF